ncbi:MAG TPA: hypothetical protein VKH40_18590, partial [Alloacidobacterium sp.]|nr:hypothetical protein [Alloacidobacterium sp.]
RLEAWRQLGSRELNDCKSFHEAIKEYRLHREGKLVPTWRSLILLLMTFLEKPNDRESLRSYQRSHWGSSSGETCVIELSGLAARNLNAPRDRESFREERITKIRERLNENNSTVKLVVMYGRTRKESWEKIAGRTFPPDGILTSGTTIIAHTPAPVAFGLTNEYWEELGLLLRNKAKSFGTRS